MRHIIIGLSPQSTDCLLRTEQLSHRLPDNAKPVLFYVGCSEWNDKRKDIQRIVFTPEMFQEALNQTAQNTANLTQAELSEYIQNEMYQFRRVYGECLHQNVDIFQKNIKKLCKSGNVFYLIVNLASNESTGLLLAMIETLNTLGAEKIKVALLRPTADLSEINAAQIYASLLECRTIMSQKISMALFDFDDSKASFSRAVTDVAYRLFSNIAAGDFQYPLPVKEEPSFWQTQEISLFADTPKMLEMLGKQSVAGIVNRMFYGENPKDKSEEPLLWIEDLFSDKTWLMTDNYLMKDDDIIDKSPQTRRKKEAPTSIDQEWASRTQFFLEQTQKLEWKERLDSVSSSLNEVAQRHFRGRGIAMHYASSESIISETAHVIVQRIEQAVIEEWRATRCSLNVFVQWFADINNAVEQQLSHWKTQQQEQTAQTKATIDEYREILEQWNKASKGGKKDIQKQYPVEKMVHLLQQHYTADCFSKATSYGYRLLGAVIDAIGDKVNHLKKYIKEKQEDINKDLPKTNNMSVNNAVSTHHTVEYHLALDTNMASAMPPVFQKSETALYPKLRKMYVDFIDAQQGINGLMEIFDDKELNENVAKYIAQHHPFLVNHAVETEHLLFWRTMASMADKCPAIGTLKKWQEQHKPDALEVHSWQIPACPFGQPVSDRIAHICSLMTENGIVQTGLEIHPQHVHYRYTVSVPFEEIENIEQLTQHYEQTLLTADGAALSFLLHTETQNLYPEFETCKDAHIQPDDIRQKLLFGEVLGVLEEYENGIFMQTSGTYIPLGTVYCEIPNDMGSFKFKLLSSAIENAKQTVQIDNTVALELLNQRLEKIKLHCLNGKTDLRKASWTEAGNYMPWARQADKLMRTLSQ